jgi:hypothetical protein
MKPADWINFMTFSGVQLAMEHQMPAKAQGVLLVVAT